MNNWNSLDFIILIIFVLNVVVGMARGAMREIIASLCLSLALIITIRFTVPLADFFNRSPLINNVVNNQWTQNLMNAIEAGPLTADFLKQLFYCISLLICFVGAYSITAAGLSRTGFLETYSFPYAAMNRHVGGLLGFIRAYVINLILLLILMLHLFNGNAMSGLIGPQYFSNSYFAKFYRGSVIRLDALITGQNPDKYRDIFKDQDFGEQAKALQNILNSGTVPEIPSIPEQLKTPPSSSVTPPQTQPTPQSAQPSQVTTGQQTTSSSTTQQAVPVVLPFNINNQ